jgi:hypothetical protein
LITLVIAAVLLQATPPAESDATVIAPRPGDDVGLLDEVRRIGRRVEILRGETFTRPPFAVRVPDHMREIAAEIRIYDVLSRERLEARGRAWADIGLGDTGSPRRLYLSLAADLEGLGFDPQGNQLLVAPGKLPPGDFEPTGGEDDPATVLMLTGMRPHAPVVSHLLMHVRQRERTGRDSLEDRTDRLLASSGWAEGEANLTAIRYLFAGMQVTESVMGFVKSPAEVLDGMLVPSGLDRLTGIESDLVHFVYFEGYRRAAELHRGGGWKALDDAMKNRQTTSDLMHPERDPRRRTEFPEPEPPEQGMELVDEDSLGEQTIVTLVSHLTGKDSLGLQAGDGWAGDRLYRWEDDSGAVGGITEWITRWNDAGPSSAADFDYAYGRALEARFPGRTLADVGNGERTLLTTDRIYRIHRQGAAVRVIVRPLGASAAAPEAR